VPVVLEFCSPLTESETFWGRQATSVVDQRVGLRQRTWQSLQGDARYAYETTVTEIGLSLAGQL
jgi:hypothetical protein